MRILTLLILIFTGTQSFAFFESKNEFFDTLRLAGYRTVVEMPYKYRPSAPKIINTKAYAMKVEAVGHKKHDHSTNAYATVEFEHKRLKALDYIQYHKSNNKYLAVQIGEVMVCYYRSKRDWRKNTWKPHNGKFKHCLIFPYSIDEVVEAVIDRKNPNI